MEWFNGPGSPRKMEEIGSPHIPQIFSVLPWGDTLDEKNRKREIIHMIVDTVLEDSKLTKAIVGDTIRDQSFETTQSFKKPFPKTDKEREEIRKEPRFQEFNTWYNKEQEAILTKKYAQKQEQQEKTEKNKMVLEKKKEIELMEIIYDGLLDAFYTYSINSSSSTRSEFMKIHPNRIPPTNIYNDKKNYEKIETHEQVEDIIYRIIWNIFKDTYKRHPKKYPWLEKAKLWLKDKEEFALVEITKQLTREMTQAFNIIKNQTEKNKTELIENTKKPPYNPLWIEETNAIFRNDVTKMHNSFPQRTKEMRKYRYLPHEEQWRKKIKENIHNLVDWNTLGTIPLALITTKDHDKNTTPWSSTAWSPHDRYCMYECTNEENDTLVCSPEVYKELKKRNNEINHLVDSDTITVKTTILNGLVEAVWRSVFEKKFLNTLKKEWLIHSIQSQNLTILQTDKTDDILWWTDFIVLFAKDKEQGINLLAVDMFVSILEDKWSDAETTVSNARTSKKEKSEKYKDIFNTYLHIAIAYSNQKVPIQPVQRFVYQEKPEDFMKIFQQVLFKSIESPVLMMKNHSLADNLSNPTENIHDTFSRQELMNKIVKLPIKQK